MHNKWEPRTVLASQNAGNNVKVRLFRPGENRQMKKKTTLQGLAYWQNAAMNVGHKHTGVFMSLICMPVRNNTLNKQ